MHVKRSLPKEDAPLLIHSRRSFGTYPSAIGKFSGWHLQENSRGLPMERERPKEDTVICPAAFLINKESNHRHSYNQRIVGRPYPHTKRPYRQEYTWVLHTFVARFHIRCASPPQEKQYRHIPQSLDTLDWQMRPIWIGMHIDISRNILLIFGNQWNGFSLCALLQTTYYDFLVTIIYYNSESLQNIHVMVYKPRFFLRNIINGVNFSPFAVGYNASAIRNPRF